MARRSPPRKVTYFEPVPPRLARNTVIESTFEVGRRFHCTMHIDCSQLEPGAVIRPVPGEWQPHMPAQLDEEELADWRAGRAAVYQLAALTVGARLAVADGLAGLANRGALSKTDRITTSGQPTEQQLADIQGLGVRHIINLGLHTHEKALPDEAASVSRLGMTYIHIPVDFQNPTEADFAKFCSAMKQLKEVPAHVHCIANYRVSAFFYRSRRDVLEMNEARLAPRWNRFGTQGRLGGVCRSVVLSFVAASTRAR